MTNRVKQGFRRRAALKAGAIHPAAWLCSRVKFIRRRRRGLPGAFLLVLPGRHRIRGEPARSGAAKRCYGKSVWRGAKRQTGSQESIKKPATRFAGFFSLRVYLVHLRKMWWSWRELNPRPKLLHRRHYMLSPVFTFAGQLRTDTPLTD